MYKRQTKDRATVERKVDIRIPYALVVAANGAVLVRRAGAIIEPANIYPGMNLLAGDVVQVGNEFIWSGPYLTVRFCNGQQVTLQSETPSGLFAEVGRGSFNNRTSVLEVSLKNLGQAVRSDPRRYGRLLFYKALGNTLDGLLGIPDPVGWTVTTPGGKLEQWLADFTESAYQPKGRVGSGGAGLAGGATIASDTPWAAGVVEFYSDGTARAYNRGATMTIRSPSASRTVPLGAMTVARLDAPAGEIAAPGIAPVKGGPPLISMIPADGDTGVHVRPELSFTVIGTDENAVIPGSVICRLDGRLLPSPELDQNKFASRLPPGTALGPGVHKWEVELALLNGATVRTSATFRVTERLPAPRNVRAYAGQQRVALRWDLESLASATGGFRVYRTSPGATRSLVSGSKPLRQPNFVDASPVAGASYEVVGLDSSGREGLLSDAVTPSFPGPAQPTPANISVSVQTTDSGGTLALSINDTTAGFTLWRIEASSASADPFADILDGELTSVTPFPIPRQFEETRRWFRVTPINIDGQAGAPVVVGPVALPRALPPVTGLTASLTADGAALLRWDPWTVQSPVGYRVEKWNNNSWISVADLNSATLTWMDAQVPANQLVQWRVKARLSTGIESPPSAPVAMRAQPASPNRGTIRFADSDVQGAEG
ncbi:MAG: hypothetical protein N3G20_04580, partial [Verrucomicrobiae bacterium]|nr:hypothetical protein [Verrucomicrobiae bacterium]